MYTLSLQRDFSARHYLIGGDWGPENDPHAHAYRVEVRLKARELDAHGYLVDLDKLEQHLDACVAAYRDRLLNNLPDFDRINPSIEHFAECFYTRFLKEFGRHRFLEIEIRIWENDMAWASYRKRYS
jgi:6-pyruvoyltetrahydropterin/6-carboxytetrahydropterin synthase